MNPAAQFHQNIFTRVDIFIEYYSIQNRISFHPKLSRNDSQGPILWRAFFLLIFFICKHLKWTSTGACQAVWPSQDGLNDSIVVDLEFKSRPRVHWGQISRWKEFKTQGPEKWKCKRREMPHSISATRGQSKAHLRKMAKKVENLILIRFEISLTVSRGVLCLNGSCS